MARVVLHGVTKVYSGGVKAVDSFSLDIADGEFVVLVGPSGCGKSTLLRLVAGLEEITSGEIELNGRAIGRLPAKDRDLAMVFQSYALYPHMTVGENIAFGLRMRGVAREKRDARVLETARMLGLQDLLERKPGALSGGQRQRVAVGRAIVRKPQCFLFDEPLSNLDAKLRVEMRTEIKRLQIRLGTTAIYVTHDQEEAMTLGDRVVVLKDGVVQQVGPPLEIYHRPANQFVAGFLGTPQMNFLNGKAFGLGVTTVGIRPQALRLAPSNGGCLAIGVKVGLIEMLGDRMDVFGMTAGGEQVVARVEAAPGLRPEQEISLYADRGEIHRFGPEGETLAGGGG